MACFFFQFALNKSGIFHEISDVLDYFIVCYLQDLKKFIKMPVMWKFSEDARKIVENVYTYFVEEKHYRLKMPLERAWGRTVALTGVSRATAQIIV